MFYLSINLLIIYYINLKIYLKIYRESVKFTDALYFSIVANPDVSQDPQVRWKRSAERKELSDR